MWENPNQTDHKWDMKWCVWGFSKGFLKHIFLTLLSILWCSGLYRVIHSVCSHQVSVQVHLQAVQVLPGLSPVLRAAQGLLQPWDEPVQLLHKTLETREMQEHGVRRGGCQSGVSRARWRRNTSGTKRYTSTRGEHNKPKQQEESKFKQQSVEGKTDQNK